MRSFLVSGAFGANRRYFNTKSSDFIPRAKYNPFAGGIQFPSTQPIATTVSSGKVKKVDNAESPQVQRNYPTPMRPEQAVASWKPAAKGSNMLPTKQESEDEAERLLRHENYVARQDIEAGARLAVRKLMTLHFHTQKHVKAEKAVQKIEEETVVSRYLSERQRIKAKNAVSAVIAGELPMPNSKGFVQNAAMYKSVMEKRADRAEAVRTRGRLSSKRFRREGTFVASPENTSRLLSAKVDESIEDESWIERVSSGGGRSMDEILQQHNLKKEEDVQSTETLPEEEWADANDATFGTEQETNPVQENDDEVESERLSEGSSANKAKLLSPTKKRRTGKK